MEKILLASRFTDRGGKAVNVPLQAVRYSPLRSEREGTFHPQSCLARANLNAGPPAVNLSLLHPFRNDVKVDVSESRSIGSQ